MIKLESYISNKLKAPDTASNYIKGLTTSINKLAFYADSIAVSQSAYIQFLCGEGVRRVNYKKMAILYVIYEDFVHIKRVIPGSLIR
ncbi:hypothetical protein Barb7_02775 [Bacteroidales bacterium Barb7]|nr:hypothetical protein Barb6XT_00632 [Bacteroidales bacterium Barb6XT]OAV73839.1 hypothetical protein Barb7_02775 [Bacteroidales bacterium Barb7]